MKALRAVVGRRTNGLVFVTKYGNAWTVVEGGRDPLAYEFCKLTTTAKIHRKGVTTFYSLRRTFETIAAAADVNQAVIDHIMGHARDDMASVYRQRIFDAQLVKVTEHVRKWYLGTVTLECDCGLRLSLAFSWRLRLPPFKKCV